MSLGEIGCALSHYFIWKDIVDKSHKGALIIEDDANFSNNFKTVFALAVESSQFEGNCRVLIGFLSVCPST